MNCYGKISLVNFIFDEWLWADLSGENGPNKQGESSRILLTVFKKCDRIVIVKGSKFVAKSQKFWKHTDKNRRGIAIFFSYNFLYNLDKSVPIDPDQLKPIPNNLAGVIKDDDHYLIQAYLTIPDSTIITTDLTLKEILKKNDIPCKYRDDLIKSY